jgi:hypothetical protein
VDYSKKGFYFSYTPMHTQQRHSTAHVLQRPIGFAPIERFAHHVGQELPTRLRIRPNQPPDLLDVLRKECPIAAAFLRLPLLHRIFQAELFVSLR